MGCGRRRLPGVDRLVEEGGRQLGEGGDRQRRRVEQAEDPRMGHLHRVAEDPFPALAQDLARVAAALGERLVEQAVERGQARAAVDAIHPFPEEVLERRAQQPAPEALRRHAPLQ